MADATDGAVRCPLISLRKNNDVLRNLDRGRRAFAWLRPEWVAVLLGLLAFLLWNGGHAFSPTRIGWVMGGLDTPQHYFGWQFFRNAPWWQWPVGYNPDYSSDAPGTIVLTDSIPLLAFTFKLFNRLLPPDFQYLGIWLFLCFELQAWFGYKLLGRLTADPVLRLLGCAMFLSAPIFLMRLYLHPALAGQWIILAALYLSLDTRLRARAWCALLLIASLVHAYLLVMAGALWLAAIAGRAVCRSDPLRQIVRHALIVMGLVVLTMWVVGYFVSSAMLPAKFISHTNLLTFILTGTCGLAEWSRFVPCIPISAESALKTGDGFGYFGLGFLLLAVAAVAVRLCHGGLPQAKISWRQWWPVLLSCLALLFFAIGSIAYVGSYLLFSFEWPHPLDRLWSTFRGAARMEWPIWYLALLMSLGVVITRLKRNSAITLLVIVLLAQYGDLSSAVVNLHKGMAREPHFEDQLTTTAWSALAIQNRHLVYFATPSVSPNILTWIPSYRQLLHYAALHDMTINAGYLARNDLSRLEAARNARLVLLEKARAEAATFYVIEDGDLWSHVLCAPDNGQWHGHISGLPVLIPEPQGISDLPHADACPASPATPKG